MNERFAFLTSNRFWAVVIGAVTLYLKTKGYIGDAETVLIETIVAPFVVIRTVDRAYEKISELSSKQEDGCEPLQRSTMKTLLAVACVGVAVYAIVARITPDRVINRAMANCYRDGVRSPDWYK